MNLFFLNGTTINEMTLVCGWIMWNEKAKLVRVGNFGLRGLWFMFMKIFHGSSISWHSAFWCKVKHYFRFRNSKRLCFGTKKFRTVGEKGRFIKKPEKLKKNFLSGYGFWPIISLLNSYFYLWVQVWAL